MKRITAIAAGLVALALMSCGGESNPEPIPTATEAVTAIPTPTPLTYEVWNGVPLYPEMTATGRADCFALFSALVASDAYNDVVNIRDATKLRTAKSVCFTTSADKDALLRFYEVALAKEGWAIRPQMVDGATAAALGLTRLNGLELGFVGFAEVKGTMLVEIGVRPGP